MLKTIFASIIWSFCIPLMSQPLPGIKIKSTKDFELKADTNLVGWHDVKWIPLPKREGKKNYETKFKILYSGTGVYCLFFCEDQVITSTIKNDFQNLYDEDVVEVFFWPEESFPVYFEYELSPNNFELPIMVPNNKGKFFGWLPWHYEGNRKTKHDAVIHSNKNWVVTFFIPFELLKPLGQVPPKPGTRWRCNFYRIDYDEQSSEWSWKLTEKTFHEKEKFGIIEFN